jgi:CHAD domain-containing protein
MAVKVGSSELLIRQRLRALSRSLPAAQDGDVPAIHQARVATRRLREALPLVASGAAGRKLQRLVRRLTRSLGSVRELDVAMLMLEEFSAARDVPRTGVTCLQKVVRDERGRLHGDMTQAVERLNLEKLTRKAVAAARARDERGSGSPRAADPAQLASARQRAARRAERLRGAIENAAGIYLPDRLHNVRIAVKKLRYAMEIDRELSGSRATTRLMTLKRAQDLLGRMHDLEVLIARTRAVQGAPNAPSLRLSADLDRLVRRLETECRQLHGHYITVRPALLAICDHVIALAQRAPRRARSTSKRGVGRDTSAA